MPSPLDGILASIAEYVGDDEAKQKELVKALQAKDGEHADALNAVAQLLINKGAGKKKGETDKTVEKAQADLTKAEERIAELEGELETAKSAPNEKQTAWDREKDKLTKRAEKAEGELKAERDGRGQDAVELSVSRFLGSLKGRVDDFGLDALQRRYRERFKVGEDRRVQVTDADGEVIEAPKGKTPEEVLADEAFEAVPAANRVRSMNSGGGSGGGGNKGPVTVEQIAEEKMRTREYGQRF